MRNSMLLKWKTDQKHKLYSQMDLGMSLALDLGMS
jgi:hypothetical protein